jgi:molybdopterin converting factor small subunit
MKLYDKLKKSITEVQEPLSQGEKNFKALHNPDFKNLVPGVTDQEHLFKGSPQRKDPKTASYEDSESAQAYDKTLNVEEEAEIDEARSNLYIGTVHKDDPDYEKKVGEMKKKAVGGHRVRGRAPLEKFKHLYKKGGELYTMTSQDVKPEHSARVDVYSRKPMKNEEVEQVEEEHQYIEVKNKHTGAIKHVKVHPSKAFAALNQYKDKNNTARIVNKKPMKEDVEQIDEVITKKTPLAKVISDFVHSKNPKFAGKSKKQRMKQALGAYYAMQRNEDVDTESDDYDFEGIMAKTELSALRDKADKLISMINDSDDLEAWVQSKISYAKSQLDGVYDYMTYSGEHKPQKPMDQTSPMAANYANFMNRMGEEFVVEKKGDDEDESDRAANKNIINQMRKAPVDGMHKITFENGKKHMIEPKHVAKALEVHANTPVAKGAKEEVQNALGRSHEDFMHVVKHGKAPAVKPKPKVSLGTMRKEEVDMPTRESGKKARQAMTMIDPTTGRVKVKYFTPARKEIKVTAEELKGNQHKIDANKNGKIDGQDFKILRGKKKVQEAEEMTAANVAKAAASQTQHGVVGKENMQQDSIDKMKSDPLASKEKVTLPPTQGNKPIGGDTQTHANVAEQLLNKLYDTLSEENKEKFEQMLETDEGVQYLLDFAREQGL